MSSHRPSDPEAAETPDSTGSEQRAPAAPAGQAAASSSADSAQQEEEEKATQDVAPSVAPPRDVLPEPSLSQAPVPGSNGDGASTAGSGASQPSLPSAIWLPELAVATLVLIGIGASLGSAAYAWLHSEALPALVQKNTLAAAERQRMLSFMAGGAAVPVLFGAAYVALRRRMSAVVQVASAARLASPLLMVFALPLLLNWRVFVKTDLLLVVCATAFALSLERLFRVSFNELQPLWQQRKAARQVRSSSEREPSPVESSKLALRVRRLLATGLARLPLLLTVGLAVFTALYFAYYTVLNHYRLQTSSWDLAIFDNMMWNLLRGEWFKASPDLGREGSHIQYHATFVAYLLLPFYALRQQADTLLVIQALIVGSGAIPLYLLTKAKTGSPWIGLLLAFAYCVHGPQHGPVFYDFHFLTIAPFFVWWVLYFFETGRKAWLIVAWIVALSLREDVSACLAVAALFLLLVRNRPWWAFWGGLLSAVYFVAMKFGIMPMHRDAADKETFAWIFGGLIPEGSKGYGGILKTVATNPVFVINAMMEPEKLAYVLRMFGPVLLLPLRYAKTWLLLLPAALFTLLSSGYKPLYQTYFQYTSNWTPYLFYGTAIVLDRLARSENGWVKLRAAVSALIVSVVVFSYHHGAMLGRENFRGGFRKVLFEYRDVDRARYNQLKSLIDMIPPGASVAATETEAPHVSSREDCFTMRFGHLDADYLLVSLDEIRRGRSRAHFSNAIATHKYGMLKQAGRFQLWKRGGPKELNNQALKQLGPDPDAKKPPARGQRPRK